MRVMRTSATDIVSFSTSASDVADSTGPTLVSVMPPRSAVGVSVNTSIVAVFNEPIDQTAQPTVSGGGVTVFGSYSVSGNTLTFRPDEPLRGNTQYAIYLSGVSDLSGNISGVGKYDFRTESIIAPPNAAGSRASL